MKKVIIFGSLMVFIFCFVTITYAADAKGQAAKAVSQKMPLRQPMRPAFNVLSGTLSKIDAHDPAKAVIEVKSDKDNTIHKIEVSPWTNISKITDISELKVGEPVRVMTRQADNREVAATVLFGNIKKLPQTTKK